MAKKDFKVDPSLAFISQESIEEADGEKENKAAAPKGKKKAPKGQKPNPEYIETKSKRVQLLLQPSLHKEAKAISKKLGISLNDFIHRAIQEAARNESVRDLIAKDVKEGR